MTAARELPLGGSGGAFAVEYAPEAIAEFAGHPKAEKLMEELEAVLGRDPNDPPGHRGEHVQGWKPLRRYRPHCDNAIRVTYAVHGRKVWILGLFPRSSDYRAKDLQKALARLGRAT